MAKDGEVVDGRIRIQSDSNANKTYWVTPPTVEGDPPTCTCPAFAIARNKNKKSGQVTYCKHIGYAVAQGWMEDPAIATSELEEAVIAGEVNDVADMLASLKLSE